MLVPPLPLGEDPSEQSNKLSSGLTVPTKKKKERIHQVKHNSQILGGAFFFFPVNNLEMIQSCRGQDLSCVPPKTGPEIMM